MNKLFHMDADAVPVSCVMTRTLNTGYKIPGIGLGTFGSDRYDGDSIAAAVRGALRVGYRLIDCAEVYGNELLIGPVFAEALEAGLPREDLFVVSKVWNDHHSPREVSAACRRSLSALRLDYLDAYLVHWPFPNFHPPGCDGETRNPDARPYVHEEFMETWRAMEQLVDEGLVRNIGVSNVTIPKLAGILRDARIRPAINEMELHPCFQQDKLFQYCMVHGIQPVGYSPLGSPARPERDRSPEDVVDLEAPEVKTIATAHGIHPSAVSLKWAVQRGQIPIPFTVTRSHYQSNLRAVCEETLTAGEMELMKKAERNNRLIKGQVFLWPGNRTWQDLWDEDGTISGW
jgi:alcohol dehydrogenase (NADP+)